MITWEMRWRAFKNTIMAMGIVILVWLILFFGLLSIFKFLGIEVK